MRRFIMQRKHEKGLTLVELIVVIGLMAVLAATLMPLIQTTFNSWRVADRRIEVVQVGRLGMDKIGRELRRAYDLASCTDSAYIDFYPDWATTTEFRVNWSTGSTYLLEFGTQAPFINDYLAGPIDEFEYLTYTRRMTTAVTAHRKVNSFLFDFKVSDERQVLPTTGKNLNPMEFRTFVQMRTSREGYKVSRSLSFSTETYYFDRSNRDVLCFKQFCDRITDPSTAVASAVLNCFGCQPGGWPIAMAYVANGDYFAGCLNIFNPPNSVTTNVGWTFPAHWIDASITDGTETCNVLESVEIRP